MHILVRESSRSRGPIEVSEHRVPQSGNCRFLAYVHSIMMEKLAQVGKGGGARPPPFIIFTITYKVAVCAPAERADILPVLHLYHTCTLCFRPDANYVDQ